MILSIPSYLALHFIQIIVANGIERFRGIPRAANYLFRVRIDDYQFLKQTRDLPNNKFLRFARRFIALAIYRTSWYLFPCILCIRFRLSASLNVSDRISHEARLLRSSRVEQGKKGQIFISSLNFVKHLSRLSFFHAEMPMFPDGNWFLPESPVSNSRWHIFTLGDIVTPQSLVRNTILLFSKESSVFTGARESVTRARNLASFYADRKQRQKFQREPPSIQLSLPYVR